MTNQFVIGPTQTQRIETSLRGGEVVLTPRQAAFIQSPPPGAVVALPPPKVVKEPSSTSARPSYTPSPETLIRQRLRSAGFEDISIEGSTVTARTKVRATLQLPKDAPYPYFLEDARMVYSSGDLATWEGFTSATVTFKLKRTAKGYTLEPIKTETEAERILEEYNARVEAALAKGKIVVPISPKDTGGRVYGPASTESATTVQRNVRVRVGAIPEPDVAARQIHRALMASAGSKTPDVFVPSEQEIAESLHRQVVQSEQSFAEAIGLGGSTQVLDEYGRWALVKTESGEPIQYWKTERIESYTPPTLVERVKENINAASDAIGHMWAKVGEDIKEHPVKYLVGGPIVVAWKGGEEFTKEVDAALRPTVADTWEKATAKGFTRSVLGVVTFPFDVVRTAKQYLGMEKPPTIVIPSGKTYPSAYMALKMKNLMQGYEAGSALGTVTVLGASNLAYGVKLARFAFEPDVYEVTYTFGRAKGAVYTPRDTKVFDVVAQQKELTTTLPKSTLSKNLRIRMVIRPVGQGKSTAYFVGATRYDVPATTLIPAESKMTVTHPLVTEVEGTTRAWAAGTIRKANLVNYGDDLMRFTLADYGETLAAKRVIESLSKEFWVPKVKTGFAEAAPATGYVEISVPVSYGMGDISYHPLAKLARDLGTMPVMSSDEYTQLIEKALMKMGTKTVVSVKPATTTPKAGMPTVTIAELEAPAQIEKLESKFENLKAPAEKGKPRTSQKVETVSLTVEEPVMVEPFAMPTERMTLAEKELLASTQKVTWRLDKAQLQVQPQVQVQTYRLKPKQEVREIVLPIQRVERIFGVRQKTTQRLETLPRWSWKLITLPMWRLDAMEAPLVDWKLDVAEAEALDVKWAAYAPLGMARPNMTSLDIPSHSPTLRPPRRRRKTPRSREASFLEGWHKLHKPVSFDVKLDLDLPKGAFNLKKRRRKKRKGWLL